MSDGTLLAQRGWPRGWIPDADPVNAPRDGLIRMSNLTLDEKGIVALRPGSSKINAVALADLDVHSLFTVSVGGTRYRMTGAGSNVYANGTSIDSGLGGVNDVFFASYQGQIFYARSTTTKKYDGTTVRKWGVTTPAGTPTVAALAPDEKTFSSCAASDFGAAGASPVEGTQAYVTGQDGTGSGAVQIIPSTTTGRGVLQKTFGGVTDFTVYDGGETGLDTDLMQLYVYVTEPLNLLSLTVMVDVNSSSAGSFQDDYFYSSITNADQIPTTAAAMTRSVLTGYQRKNLNDAQEAAGVADTIIQDVRNEPNPTSTQLRPDAPVGNVGWNKILIPRNAFIRVGSTAKKGWDTVIGIRLVVETVGGGAASAVAFDTIKFLGGNLRPLTGQYQWLVVGAYNSGPGVGTYTSLSSRSLVSAVTQLQANGATITIPADGARDTQINELWIYRFGGVLDQYYRVGIKTGVSGTGAFTFDDTKSDADALTDDLPLRVDAVPPPAGIVGIAGPYFDRLFALTTTDLYPSLRLNPDTFASGQAIHVSGSDELAKWVVKASNGLYIGTTKDIYRLDGDGAELPDDTINFTKTPLNIDHPPISTGVAQDGNTIVYMASDGWRAFTGVGSELIVGDTSLYYKGYTRAGQSPVNVTGGRFRGAIAKGFFTAITPIGASTTKSTIHFVKNLTLNNWTQHIYASSFRSIHQEPDGTLIGGDDSGFVWVLQDTTATGDGGSSIAIDFFTKIDDNDQPYNRKDPWDGRLRLDSGGATITVGVRLDGASSNTSAPTVSSSGESVQPFAISSLAAFRQIQLAISGSVTTFKLYDYGISYRPRSPLVTYAEPKPQTPSLQRRRFGGIQVIADTLSGDATITPMLDGSAQTPLTMNTADALAKSFTFPSVVGRDLWAKIAKTTGFELYELEPRIIEALPPVQQGRVADTNAGYAGRKVVTGFKIRCCTLGGAVTFTPYVDGSAVGGQAQAKTTGANEADTVILQFTTQQVGTDFGFSTSADFELYDWEPIVLRQLPIVMNGAVPSSNAGYEGEKVLAGVEIKACTLSASRTFTVYFDGVAQTPTYARTTGATDPATLLLQFTTNPPTPVTDISWSVDSDIELYDWKPIVLYQMPTKIRVWENKPLVPSATRRHFGGFSVQIDTYGSAVTVTPVLDGVDQDALATTTSDLLGKTLTFSAITGRDLWCRVSGSAVFSVYRIDPIVIETLPAVMKGITGRVNGGTPGIKTISGFQVRLCTLGSAVSITPYLDGVAYTLGATSVTSDPDDPTDLTIRFSTAQDVTEYALLFSGDVEVYEWHALVTTQRPLGLLVWDSGPLDLNAGGELLWLRYAWIKVRAGADLTITPYFDGKQFPAVTTALLPTELSTDTIIPVSIGREYRGKQPRFIVTSSAPFYPYWIKFANRQSGGVTAKAQITIPVTVQQAVTS